MELFGESLLKPIKSLIYKPISDDDIEDNLAKVKKDDLKWKPVDFNYIQNKMKGNFVICSNGTEYRLFQRPPSILWRILKAPPPGVSWKYAKDTNFEYFSMATLDGKICKIKVKKS